MAKNISRPPTDKNLSDEIQWHLKQSHILIPLKPDRKPTQAGWQKTTETSSSIREHVRDGGNVGWITKTDLVIDVDVKRGKQGIESLAKLQELITLPTTARKIRSPSGGWHIYLKGPVPAHLQYSLKDFPGIDFLTGNHYVVIGGCFYSPTDDKRYTVEDKRNGMRPAPKKLLELLTRAEYEPGPKAKYDEWDLVATLEQIDPSSLSRDEWIRMGMALKYELGEAGFILWDRWSQRDSRYGEQRPIEVDWESFQRIEDDSVLVGGGSIKYLQHAQEHPEIGVEKPLEPSSDLFHDLQDFLAQDMEPIEYLLEEFLPHASITMLFSKAGVGKTWVTYQLVRSLILGEDFLGWKVNKRLKKILIVDGELPPNLIHQRTKSILLGVEGVFIFSTLEFYDKHKRMFDIMNVKHQEFLTHMAVELGVEMIILDNKSSLTPGQPENTDEGVEDATLWMARLRSQGISTVLVHHSGKGGDQRGSSKWEGPLDLTIRLEEKMGGDKRPIPNRFVAMLGKKRHMWPDNPVVVGYIFSMDGETRVILDEVVEAELGKDQLKVLQGVKDGLTVGEIGASIGRGLRQAQRDLGDLSPMYVTKGVNTGRGQRNWTLTERGEEILEDQDFQGI